MEFDKLSDILCCPVCLEISIPPIYQCVRGHLICNKCINDLDTDICPTCRDTLPQERNVRIRSLGLEQLASSVLVQCKYADRGCTTTVKVQEMNSHILTECIYEARNFCRSMGIRCNTSVSLVDLKDHFVQSHGVRELESSFHSGDRVYSFEVHQSAILKDLIVDPTFSKEFKQVITWEPASVATELDVYSVYTGYDVGDRLFTWSLCLTSATMVDNPSLPLVEITAIPDEEEQGSSINKLIWMGKSRLNSLAIQPKTGSPSNSNSDSSKKERMSSFCIPLSFLTDVSHAPTDIDKENLISWKLQVKIVFSGRKQDPGWGPPVPPRAGFLHSTNTTTAHVVDCHIYETSDVKSSILSTIFWDVKCSICGTSPLKGRCFTCTECENYNLCHPCTLDGLHDDHILIRKNFVNPKDERKVEEGQGANGMHNVGAGHNHGGERDHKGSECSSCGTPIHGIRYKCCFCLEVDICEICHNKGFHDFHWCLRTTRHNPAQLNQALSSVPNNSLSNFCIQAERRGFVKADR